MTTKTALSIFVHPEGDSLFGTVDPDMSGTMHAPTFAEAYKIEPEFIEHASEGEVLIFADMILEIKWNEKTEEPE